MRGAIPCLLLVLLGPASAGAQSQVPAPAPQVTPPPQPGEVPLVDLMPDGSVAGWREFPPLGESARLADGVLRLPRSAWLVHSRTYSDFVLNVEFRLRSGPSRLGVLTRGWWEHGSSGINADYGYEWWFRSGRDAQAHLVIQDPTETVTIPNRFPEFLLAIGKTHEWQTLALLASADRFQVWLNGTRVADASGGIARTGLVGLRARDGIVEVRKVGIRDLSAQPLFEQALEAGVHLPIPALTKDVRPRYVASAIKRQVAGEVVVECVVVEDGTVGAVRLLRSLDADLDAESLAAVKQWQYEPPRRDGVPVKVRFAITLEFGKKQK